MKVIGEGWSTLVDDLKKQYVKLANEEKIRYDQEMVVYRKETSSMTPAENPVVKQKQSSSITAQP
jgi:hypothetical protein